MIKGDYFVDYKNFFEIKMKYHHLNSHFEIYFYLKKTILLKYNFDYYQSCFHFTLINNFKKIILSLIKNIKYSIKN